MMLAGRGSLFVCLISGADPVWSSGHEDPCTARGKAARIAAVAELHDGNAPEAPAPAGYHNGAGGTLGQTEAAPVEAEVTQEQETAETARTEATAEAAADRATPTPEARPPRARRAPQRRVSPERRMAISAGLVPAPPHAPLF
ncbi:hypothetical protein [Streptomyces halobius]|uniref:Uncharacterized protein n=1 Tax=Streptomyces halobius TaxID=2879846 RepID=A0ABY4M1J7_9ACTN|nr:hypothetical protein [Streptomyces halobius]UQA91307.1 hypothetical protein K9S39_04920 [Streptomyces halobius]